MQRWRCLNMDGTWSGDTSNGYMREEVGWIAVNDWNSLFLPKFAGKVGIFDWYLFVATKKCA